MTRLVALPLCTAFGMFAWGVCLYYLRREGGPIWSAGIWYASGFLLGSWLMFMLTWE